MHAPPLLLCILSVFLLAFCTGTALGQTIRSNHGHPALLPRQKLPDGPFQRRLAFAGAPSSVVVTWVTVSDTENESDAAVYYGEQGALTQKVSAITFHYSDPFDHTYESPNLHEATLTGLTPNTTISYVCSDGVHNSSVAEFRTQPQPGSNVETHIAVIGDHGHSSNSLMITQALQDHFEHGDPYDFVLHVGDISYANGDQPIWDQWGMMVEDLSSRVPWMVTVGNHEFYDFFIPYLSRFSMPAKSSQADFGNLWYSYDHGSIHFIALSSETPNSEHWLPMNTWLETDLQNVDRSVTPWVVVTWHRPWYNTNKAHQGEADPMKQELEPVLLKYHVDLCISGHVHAYERILPVQYGKVDLQDGIMYVTNGNGGTGEGLAKHWVDEQDWSAFRSSHWGFAMMHAANETHLHWKAHSVSSNDVVDEYWLVKDHSRL